MYNEDNSIGFITITLSLPNLRLYPRSQSNRICLLFVILLTYGLLLNSFSLSGQYCMLLLVKQSFHFIFLFSCSRRGPCVPPEELYRGWGSRGTCSESPAGFHLRTWRNELLVLSKAWAGVDRENVLSEYSLQPGVSPVQEPKWHLVLAGPVRL